MRDRFAKKLEHRLPAYVKKFKAGVLDKYAMKTSSSGSGTEGEQSSKGERSNQASPL